MTAWYTLARKEWASLTGSKLKHKKSIVKWESAVGTRKASEASTALALAWRRCARRAEDVARLWGRAEPTTTDTNQHLQALHAHQAAIAAARDSLPPGIPEVLKDELDR